MSGALRRYSGLAVTGLGVLGGLRILSRWQYAVEAVYATHVGPAIVRLLATVSGLVPVSLVEMVVLAAVVWWLRPMWAAARAVRDGTRRGREVAIVHLARSAATLVVTAATFYLSWGLNYARPDLVTRQGWEAYARTQGDDSAAIAELAGISQALVEAGNEAYRQATGATDLGRPSHPVTGQAALDGAIDVGYERVAHLLGLPHSFAASRGRAKPVAISIVMSYAGIVGFYFPWTGEANYDRLVPAWQLPHAIAHEKAHQRGVASEDEASFMGYLATAQSDEPYVRYSGCLFAQRQLLAELWQLDRARASEIVARRLPGVQRDVDAGNAYWRRYEGRASRANRDLNDAYLSFHGVAGGIESYSRSARLLVIFSRLNGGQPIGSLAAHAAAGAHLAEAGIPADARD